jgi:hypothetical protein
MSEPEQGSRPAPGGAGQPAAGADPSMEDILASIRRILAEEEASTAAGSTDTAAEPPAQMQVVQAPPVEVDGGVLQLDASMMLPEPVAPPVEAAVDPFDAAPARVEPPPPEPPAVPPAAPQPEITMSSPASSLMGAEAAAAATTSVGSLLRTLSAERTTQVYTGGPTIEDVVRAELRPLLKQWLDTNLPSLVERLVRAEIERVVSRAVP